MSTVGRRDWDARDGSAPAYGAGAAWPVTTGSQTSSQTTIQERAKRAWRKRERPRKEGEVGVSRRLRGQQGSARARERQPASSRRADRVAAPSIDGRPRWNSTTRRCDKSEARHGITVVKNSTMRKIEVGRMANADCKPKKHKRVSRDGRKTWLAGRRAHQTRIDSLKQSLPRAGRAGWGSPSTFEILLE